MKKNVDLLNLNSIVAKKLDTSKIVTKKMRDLTNEFVASFNKHNLAVKVLGSMGTKTLISAEEQILEIAIIKFRPKNADNVRKYIIEKVYEVLGERYNNTVNIDHNIDGGYLEYLHKDTVNFKVRIIPFCYKKNAKGLYSYNYYRKNKERIDNAIVVVDSFNKANKISNNLLRTIMKLLKFMVHNDFTYYYSIYSLVLRWFYEYFVKKYNEYIYNLITKNDFNKYDLEKIKSINFQKLWFFHNIDSNEIITYIMERLWKEETYFFRQFSFAEEDIFDSISRYSWYTNKSFLIPYDYYTDLKIYNLEVFTDLEYVQNTLNSDTISRIHYHACRNFDNKIYITPIKTFGSIGFWDYANKFPKKAESLFKKLPPDKRVTASEIYARENMDQLNLIAHKWLTSYQNKLSYLKVYFDRKYPIISNVDPKIKLNNLIKTVEKLKNNDYIIGFDN
ncbi:hypothetical protein NPX79_03245 [Spiroplasma endosymbiont of Anurida maritima]|uniref:hypothetical protein n=1 Tax=Spiroplasma endosymbiont of Anurida maritima TaxID=2967972 RepID=UPI0036D26E4B